MHDVSRKAAEDHRTSDPTSQPRVIFYFISAIPLVASGVQVAGGPLSLALVAWISGFCGVILAMWELKWGIGLGQGYSRFVVLVGFLFWFWIPGIQTSALSGQFEQTAVSISINNAYAGKAYFLISVFLFSFVLSSRHSRFTPASITVSARWKHATPPMLFKTMLIMAGVGFLFYLLASGGNPLAAVNFALSGRSGAKPWSSNGNFGTGLTAFAVIAQALLVVSAVLGLVLGAAPTIDSERIPTHFRVIASIVGIVCTAWVSIDSGTRSTLLECVAPALFVILRAFQGRIKIAGKLSIALVLLGMGALLVYAASAQLTYRRSDAVQRLINPQNQVNFDVQGNDFVSMTAYAIAVSDQIGGHTHGVSPVEIVVAAIPHSIWPGQPLQSSTEIFSRYFFGRDIAVSGGNSLPSVVGQHYIDWGLAGVVGIGFLFGFATRTIDHHVPRGSPVLATIFGGVAATYLFLEFRVVSFGFLSPAIIALLLGWRPVSGAHLRGGAG